MYAAPHIKLTDASPEHDDFHVRHLVFLRHVIFRVGYKPGNSLQPSVSVEIHCIFVQLQNTLDLYFHEVGKLSTMKWHLVWDPSIHGSASKK